MPGVCARRQVFADPAGDHDWGIAAVIDLDASDETGTAVVRVIVRDALSRRPRAAPPAARVDPSSATRRSQRAALRETGRSSLDAVRTGIRCCRTTQVIAATRSPASTMRSPTSTSGSPRRA